MANGRVITGFSKPYVGLYAYSSGSISYSDEQILARGVSVDVSLESSDDNNFYADNVLAESAAGQFGGGTLTLTVDGLKDTAAKLILGLPTADGDGWTAYGDSASIPYVGVGFIVRYQEDGVTSWMPVFFPKCKFMQPGISAATQEENIDWQTEELQATILRDDDTNHNWMYKCAAATTEALAETALQGMF